MSALDRRNAHCVGQACEESSHQRSRDHHTGAVLFSLLIVMNKCFLLNPEKEAQICLVVFEKNAKNAHFNSEK